MAVERVPAKRKSRRDVGFASACARTKTCAACRTAEGARVSEQYARLREQAEAERRRAASTMHEIFEQNAGEAQALFEEANERFAETCAA